MPVVSARQFTIAIYNEKALALATLLSFLKGYGEKRKDGGIILKHKITQEMLARCLGASIRSIERTMVSGKARGG